MMAIGACLAERSNRGWFLYGAGAAIGFYLHAFFATTIAAFAIVLLIAALLRGSIRQWLLAHMAVFVAIVPGLVLLKRQVDALTMHNGRIPWGATPSFGNLLQQGRVVLTGSEGGAHYLLAIWICLGILIVAIVRGEARLRGMACVAILALLLAFFLAIRSGGFLTRYNVPPLTLMLITVAAGMPLIAPNERSLRRAVPVAAIAVLALVHVWAILAYAEIQRSSSRDVAAILAKAPANDWIVI